MQEIKQKIEELAALIKEHKPTAANQQKFHAIRNYIALVSGVSLHESRVKPGGRRSTNGEEVKRQRRIDRQAGTGKEEATRTTEKRKRIGNNKQSENTKSEIK
jgi:hypothetical protein